MLVLGLDTSTKTGLALVDSAKNIVYTEQVQFKTLKGWERCAAIISSIMAAHEKYKPDLVVMEGYGFANPHTLSILVEVGTIIRYFLWQNDIPYLVVPPKSLKRFVLGKGVGDKKAMMAAVLQNWGHKAKTDDIADAIGLAMFGLCCGGVQFGPVALQACNTVLEGQPEFYPILKSLKRSAINCTPV